MSTTKSTAVLELRDVTKRFGNVEALRGVSFAARPGEIHCLLGDNGAGKSTLIKIMSGVHPPSAGSVLVDGEATRFRGPRDAMACGIATVFQDLAVAPLMSIARNFCLGREPRKRFGPFWRMNFKEANETAVTELRNIGINVRDSAQLVGTLSGGEQQAVAIARAVRFGARVLILDEPTSALGVKEAGVVLSSMIRARERGVAVVFISHNVHHAFPVGDRFTVLNRGTTDGTLAKNDTTREEILTLMAGGEELEKLDHELAEFARVDREKGTASGNASADETSGDAVGDA
jgi:simple sugar transport system ATP-binding protein